MSGQFIAASLMFFITIAMTSVFWYPAYKISIKNNIVKFYWVGFWAFLGAISAFAGAQAVLVILGQNVENTAGAILAGITAAFIMFVVFAWGRLTLKGFSSFVQKKD